MPRTTLRTSQSHDRQLLASSGPAGHWSTVASRGSHAPPPALAPDSPLPDRVPLRPPRRHSHPRLVGLASPVPTPGPAGAAQCSATTRESAAVPPSQRYPRSRHVLVLPIATPPTDVRAGGHSPTVMRRAATRYHCDCRWVLSSPFPSCSSPYPCPYPCDYSPSPDLEAE